MASLKFYTCTHTVGNNLYGLLNKTNLFLLAIQAFKSVPVSTTPDCINNASSSRTQCASKSTLAAPATRDQSTSTATLSSLLHTERMSDSMDNKISECINKLRQVCVSSPPQWLSYFFLLRVHKCMICSCIT